MKTSGCYGGRECNTNQIAMNDQIDFIQEPINGKSVLITGATTGIGRATALLLASHGARVMIFGRHERELDDTLRDVQAKGLDHLVHGLIADTSDEGDIRRVFEEVDRVFGRLDILINNAAVGYGSIVEGTYTDWQQVLEINLLAYLACAHEAAVRMRNRKSGHIVNVGSMSADVRESGSSVYVATKAGVQGFSEALRKEVNGLGIKVTLIEPGAVGTDLQDEDSSEKQREEEKNLTMLKAEDIAACILYTLSQPDRCEVVNVKIKPRMQLI